MTYNEALDYITDIYHLGSKLGLERITMLMARLNNPQDRLKIIHVAGTNGKGSTCAILDSILQHAGLNVGLYTSPHLERYNERFVINGAAVSDDDFAYHVGLIKKHCDDMIADDCGCPTVFEVLTALAFNYFYESHVDIVIMEVGLGGLLDATNIINNPLLCVITSIGFDHMEILGDNIASIAKEKGGIIKENSIVVLHTQTKEVYNVISNICEDKQSSLYYNSNLFIDIIKQDLSNTVFNVNSDFFYYSLAKINLLGKYQIYNASTAMLAAFALNNYPGINITKRDVYLGLSKATWRGRMEIVRRDPYIILDGAHNIDGVRMLRESMETYFKYKNITLLIAVLADKKYDLMIEELMRFSSKVVVTQVSNTRALNADFLFDLVKKYDKISFIEKNIENSLLKAIDITDTCDVICCCGSLYLIGELRRLL